MQSFVYGLLLLLDAVNIYLTNDNSYLVGWVLSILFALWHLTSFTFDMCVKYRKKKGWTRRVSKIFDVSGL